MWTATLAAVAARSTAWRFSAVAVSSPGTPCGLRSAARVKNIGEPTRKGMTWRAISPGMQSLPHRTSGPTPAYSAFRRRNAPQPLKDVPASRAAASAREARSVGSQTVKGGAACDRYGQSITPSRQLQTQVRRSAAPSGGRAAPRVRVGQPSPGGASLSRLGGRWTRRGLGRRAAAP
jgi:hypothetical protein